MSHPGRTVARCSSWCSRWCVPVAVGGARRCARTARTGCARPSVPPRPRRSTRGARPSPTRVRGGSSWPGSSTATSARSCPGWPRPWRRRPANTGWSTGSPSPGPPPRRRAGGPGASIRPSCSRARWPGACACAASGCSTACPARRRPVWRQRHAGGDRPSSARRRAPRARARRRRHRHHRRNPHCRGDHAAGRRRRVRRCGHSRPDPATAMTRILRRERLSCTPVRL